MVQKTRGKITGKKTIWESKMTIEDGEVDYETIDDFGENVLVAARDQVIEEELATMKGTQKPRISQELHLLLKDFSNEQKEVLKKFIIEAVDSTIMEILWRISENTSNFFIMKQKSPTKFMDLNVENPEGLEGIFLTSVDAAGKYNMIDTILKTGQIEKEPSISEEDD